MIYLLTPDMILYECLRIAQHQMAEVLRTHPSNILPQVHRKDDGSMDFEFQIDPDNVKGVTEDEIKEVIRHIYAEVKEELEKRIADALQTRDDVLRRLRGEAFLQ